MIAWQIIGICFVGAFIATAAGVAVTLALRAIDRKAARDD